MRMPLPHILRRTRAAAPAGTPTGDPGEASSRSGGAPGPGYDAELLALAEELTALGAVEVPTAARHRSLARVREELASAPLHHRRRVPHVAFGLRLAAAGVLVAGALAAAVVGLSSPKEEQVAGTDTTLTTPTGPPASVTLPEGPPSTVPPPGTTTPDFATPDTTTSGTSAPDAPINSSTLPPSSGGGGQGTTMRTVPSVPTTKPATTVSTQAPTSTTARQALTREQRESSAFSAASFLAEAVIARDQGAAASVVSSSGGSGLALMFASLNNPLSYSILSVDASQETSARVLLEITDRRIDSQGEPVQVGERFILLVRLDAGGVYVSSIYAAGRQ